MNIENKNRQDVQDAMNLISLGYRDYIGARFLINNDFLIQGVTLASTAIEKYLKAMLKVTGHKRKIHMEKWKEIKNLLALNGVGIFNELDSNFLQLLSKAYKLRYYDDVDNQVQYGFINWQVLGELDFTVNLIEQSLSVRLTTGETWKSLYMKAVDNKDEVLYKENYVLNNIEKKEYMEREGRSLFLIIDRYKREFHIEGYLRVEKYSGTIAFIKNAEVPSPIRP